MADPTTKTVQVRIELPEDLHVKLLAEAKEDERTLSVYIARVLRGLRPRVAAFPRQSVVGPIPAVAYPTLTLEPSQAGNPLAEPLPPPLAPTDDLPIEQWDDARLLNMLQEKRAVSQAERARIATIASPPEAEKAKAALEHLLKFVAVLEAEVMKRRGKVQKKAPQPPRANPNRVS